MEYPVDYPPGYPPETCVSIGLQHLKANRQCRIGPRSHGLGCPIGYPIEHIWPCIPWDGVVSHGISTGCPMGCGIVGTTHRITHGSHGMSPWCNPRSHGLPCVWDIRPFRTNNNRHERRTTLWVSQCVAGAVHAAADLLCCLLSSLSRRIGKKSRGSTGRSTGELTPDGRRCSRAATFQAPSCRW